MSRPRQSDLTFACEELGRNPQHGKALLLVLTELLYHESPLVREGALLGLLAADDEENLTGPLRIILVDRLKEETSPAMINMIKEVLEG